MNSADVIFYLINLLLEEKEKDKKTASEDQSSWKNCYCSSSSSFLHKKRTKRCSVQFWCPFLNSADT